MLKVSKSMKTSLAQQQGKKKKGGLEGNPDELWQVPAHTSAKRGASRAL